MRDAAARGVQVILVRARVHEVFGLVAFHNALRHRTLEHIRGGGPASVHTIHLRQASRQSVINLHSKLMIVDACLAIIGSANVSCRSKGTASELALSVVDGERVVGRMGGKPVELPLRLIHDSTSYNGDLRWVHPSLPVAQMQTGFHENGSCPRKTLNSNHV
nr:phospholipase D-like domain-containing protein [Deinococcus planocerae]